MARKKKEEEIEIKFDLERKLLDDFKIALEDTSDTKIPVLQMETSLVHQVHVNSLVYLESIQIVSDKYGVTISTEELNGSPFVGRVINCLKEKIYAKYGSDNKEIYKIATETKLNLAENTKRTPALVSKFIGQAPEQKSKKRR